MSRSLFLKPSDFLYAESAPSTLKPEQINLRDARKELSLTRNR